MIGYIPWPLTVMVWVAMRPKKSHAVNHGRKRRLPVVAKYEFLHPIEADFCRLNAGEPDGSDSLIYQYFYGFFRDFLR